MDLVQDLLPRLREILGGRDLGNGTPLADAAAVAIVADAQVAGAASADVLALTDDVLFEAADRLQCHLLTERHLILPFGAKLDHFGVKIGELLLLADAGRPGLHPAYTTREDAHGPNLDRLIAILHEETRGHPYCALGLPTPSSAGRMHRPHYLEFPAFGPAGGVVLRQQVSPFFGRAFCSLMLQDLKNLASRIVRAMDKLWSQQAAVGHRVEAVRGAVEARLRMLYGQRSPVSLRLIALDWEEGSGLEESEHPYLHIEYNALDDALRPGTVLQLLSGDTDTDDLLFPVEDSWEARAQKKAEFLKFGAVGDIDALALALAQAAPEGQRVVLGRLAQELATTVTLPGSTHDIYGKLEWISGCVHGFVLLPGLIRGAYEGLALKAVLPEAVMAAAVGRPLSDIATLPFALDSVIQKVEPKDDGWLNFTLERKPLLIDAETGEFVSAVLRPRGSTA